MLHRLCIILLLTAYGFIAYAQQDNSPNWLTFEQLNDSLAVKEKPVIIFLHTDWCRYCRKMLNETFPDKNVTEVLNSKYYAVKFDAESIDSVFFDGVYYTNQVTSKTTGKNHALANIFTGQQNPAIFPVTIILNKDFKMVNRKFNYLSTKQLLKIL